MKKIYLFFILVIIELLTLVLFLIPIFGLSIQDLSNEQNIPNLAKYIYIISFYFFILFNLFKLDRENFLSVFNNFFKAIKTFALGFMSALVTLVSFYFIEISFGFIALKEFTLDFTLLAQVLFTSFFIGLIEELLFRNFIFKNLSLEKGERKGLIISSYIYAQLHFLRFNLSLLEFIIPLLGLFFVGLILGTLYKKYNFWLVVGIHSSLVLLISYTTQNNSFIINKPYLLFSGGYYPIAGILGVFIAFIITIFTFRLKEKT